MAASIIHFGPEECIRLEVLSRRGFRVRDCGTSMARLHEELCHPPVDGVVVTEDQVCHVPDEVVSCVRSATSAPLILFDGLAREYDTSSFDLVIGPGGKPDDWLREIETLIEHSKGIRAQSAALREKSAVLRAASSALTQDKCARQLTTSSRN